MIFFCPIISLKAKHKGLIRQEVGMEDIITVVAEGKEEDMRNYDYEKLSWLVPAVVAAVTTVIMYIICFL